MVRRSVAGIVFLPRNRDFSIAYEMIIDNATYLQSPLQNALQRKMPAHERA
jgi:hypothetical protein